MMIRKSVGEETLRDGGRVVTIGGGIAKTLGGRLNLGWRRHTISILAETNKASMNSDSTKFIN